MGSFIRSVRLGALIPERLKSLPERFKGGRVENWAFYWKGIYADYREVGREVLVDARTKPFKAFLIGAGLTSLTVAFNTVPNDHTFRHQLLENANRLSLVSTDLRNPISDRHIEFLLSCHNEGLLRTLNLGFFSLLWVENYDVAVTQYAAQCEYLKPKYLTFHKRIVDFGMYGKWHVMDWKMKDYDVNDNEWNPMPTTTLATLNQ